MKHSPAQRPAGSSRTPSLHFPIDRFAAGGRNRPLAPSRAPGPDGRQLETSGEELLQELLKGDSRDFKTADEDISVEDGEDSWRLLLEQRLKTW